MSLLDLISKHASPGLVIRSYSFFGLFRLFSRINSNRHYRENLVLWNSSGPVSEHNDPGITLKADRVEDFGDTRNSVKMSAMGIDGKYIEHQDRLTMLRYGGGRGYPISYGGCEMIAVYNLLSYLNDGRIPAGFDFPDIIRAFEGNGIALEGAFGASPKGMVRYLKRSGLSPVMSRPGKLMDTSALEGKPFIFTAFNDRRHIWSQVHTMAATPEPDGSVILHNSYETPAGFSRYRDPADVIINYRRGMARAICVISLA